MYITVDSLAIQLQRLQCVGGKVTLKFQQSYETIPLESAKLARMNPREK